MTPFKGSFQRSSTEVQRGSRRTDGRGEGGADTHGARGQQQLRHRGAHAAATSAVGAVGTLDAFLEKGRVNHTGDAGLGQGHWTMENYGELWGSSRELWKYMEISEVGKFPDLGNLWNQGSHCQVNIGALLRLTVKRTCRENVGKMWLSSKRCRSLFSFTQILTFKFTIHGRSRS